jgi:hypothetical protein
MIPREGAAAAIRAVLAGSQAHDQELRLGVAEGRHGTAVVSRLLQMHGIQECCKPGATAAAGIENTIHGQPNWGRPAGRSNKKTGYAEPRVARHHSRLDFGLTRAQLNLWPDLKPRSL